jgi:hypothetical protein
MGGATLSPGKSSPEFALQLQVVQAFLRLMQDFDENSSPVILAGEMLHVVKNATGNVDPYYKEKMVANELCLPFAPALQAELDGLPDAKDRLRKALFWAIAGNNIDFITPGHAIELTEAAIRRVLEETEEIGLVRDDYDALWGLLTSDGTRVVYLLDNAGEIVFDKLALGVLKSLGIEVAAVVKGGPISNDATLEDAQTVQLAEACARVVTTGADDLGFNWDAASAEFQALFEGTPVVIAKGQANFEAFHAFGDRMPPEHFFGVLKVKCIANAAIVGGEKGQQVIMKVPVE